MASFKRNNTQANTVFSGKAFSGRYNRSRNSLLIVVTFTLINMILLLAKSSTYFLFSASIPYYLTFFGLLHTGKLPADYYYGWHSFEAHPTSFLVILIIISVILIALYALCWYLSKKQGHIWLIVALVLFGIDTVFLLGFIGFSVDSLFDIVFHIWIIVSLASGISSAVKLKKAPPAEEAPESNDDCIAEIQAPPSPPPFIKNEILKEAVNDIPEDDKND